MLLHFVCEFFFSSSGSAKLNCAFSFNYAFNSNRRTISRKNLHRFGVRVFGLFCCAAHYVDVIYILFFTLILLPFFYWVILIAMDTILGKPFFQLIFEKSDLSRIFTRINSMQLSIARIRVGKNCHVSNYTRLINS